MYYSSTVPVWMANLFLGTTSRILSHVVYFSSKSYFHARFTAFTTPCASYSFQRLHKIDKIWRRKRTVSVLCCCYYAVRRKSGTDRAGHGGEVRGWFAWLGYRFWDTIIPSVGGVYLPLLHRKLYWNRIRNQISTTNCQTTKRKFYFLKRFRGKSGATVRISGKTKKRNDECAFCRWFYVNLHKHNRRHIPRPTTISIEFLIITTIDSKCWRLNVL